MPNTASRSRGRPKTKTTIELDAQNKLRSLDRALDVLDLLATGEGLTLSEISLALNESPATISRVLTTFEARGILEVEPKSQTWFVGPTSFLLGSSFLRRTSVVERSRPLMRELMEKTGETANLGIENSGLVVFVSQVETHQSIRAFFPPGTQSPMHASGIGKALLAFLPEDKINRILEEQTFEKFTDKTIVDVVKLREELSLIRSQGYAFDDEEKTLGMRCIAAPIVNFFGEVVAGISLSGPTQRMTLEKVDSIAELVCDAAKTISSQLGSNSFNLKSDQSNIS